jgi:hypothetical protein
MIAPRFLFVLLPALAAALAADSTPRPAIVPLGSHPPANPGLFSLIGPDYKKPQEVPDTLFNPFKVEASNELMQRRGAAVTDQSVASAVVHRGVSGVVYGGDGRANQVIIGDQVFRIGDELTFPSAEGSSPLLPGASVTLREVNRNSLVFDYATEGEGSRRAIVSLRSFWRP